MKGPHQNYVVRLDWYSTKSKVKEIVWKLPVPAPITSLLVHNNLLYIGFKTGVVQILELLSFDRMKSDEIDSELISYKGSTYRVADKKSAVEDESKVERTIEKVDLEDTPKVIFNQKLFEGDKGKGDGEISRIVYLNQSSKIAVVGGLKQKRGDIAIFSEHGKLLLNTHLGDAIIRGIAQTESGLFLVNTRGALYHLPRGITKDELDKSVIKVKLEKEILSNITVVRDWICGSGPETLSFFFSKDLQKRSERYMGDTFARIVWGHEYGVITGDDLGKIRFWKIGHIKLHEE